MSFKIVSVGVCNERHKALNDDVGEMKDDIKLIKNNHLVHLQKDLNEIKGIVVELQVSNKLTKWLVPILITLISIGAQVIITLAAFAGG